MAKTKTNQPNKQKKKFFWNNSLWKLISAKVWKKNSYPKDLFRVTFLLEFPFNLLFILSIYLIVFERWYQYITAKRNLFLIGGNNNKELWKQQE